MPPDGTSYAVVQLRSPTYAVTVPPTKILIPVPPDMRPARIVATPEPMIAIWAHSSVAMISCASRSRSPPPAADIPTAWFTVASIFSARTLSLPADWKTATEPDAFDQIS